MNIAYLALVRLPTEKAHGAQIVHMCNAFAEIGDTVTLFTTNRKTIQKDPFSFYGIERTFSLVRIRVPDILQLGPLGFLLMAYCFGQMVRKEKKLIEANVIYSRDASILLQFLGKGRRCVYEAHTKPTFISTYVAKRVSHLVVISEGLRDAYVAAGVASESITVAHDAIEPKCFTVTYKQHAVREKLQIPQERKVALYVGRLDESKGAEIFAATSESLAEVLCVLIGSGPLENLLKERYKKALVLPQTPYKMLPEVLSAGDVLVLPNSQKDENAAVYTSPLKAFAYLATKKPIVASDVPALRNALKDDAIFVPSDNSASLAQGIVKALEMKERSPRIHTWIERARNIRKSI